MVDFSFLLNLSETQLKALFYKNNLQLIETEFKNNSYWLLRNGKRIGEVLWDNGYWISNIQWIKLNFDNIYGAALLELMQQPIQGIYSEEYSAKIIKEVEVTNV
jgi:hypothetical protein